MNFKRSKQLSSLPPQRFTELKRPWSCCQTLNLKHEHTSVSWLMLTAKLEQPEKVQDLSVTRLCGWFNRITLWQYCIYDFFIFFLICVCVLSSCRGRSTLRLWAVPDSSGWSTRPQTPSTRWPSRWTSRTLWVEGGRVGGKRGGVSEDGGVSGRDGGKERVDETRQVAAVVNFTI